MLNIILTFDYELYFGKNYYDEDKVLFEPAGEIIDLLKQYDLHGTFYVDVCSVDAYKKENPTSDYPAKFAAQIQEFEKKGQDVQLHIHSHWLSAKYNGQWQVDNSTYRIHHFIDNPNAEKKAEDIIKDGIDYLYRTLKPVNPEYECYSYRAGGFCLEPRERLLQILSSNGIEIDSSVVIGKKLISETHQFDYTGDYKKLNWDLGSNVYELPIGSIRNNFFKRLFKVGGYGPMNKLPPTGDGISGTKIGKLATLNYFLHYHRYFREFAFESMSHELMLKGLEKYCKKYDTANNDVFVGLICHPKSMDKVTIANMKLFIEDVLKNNDMRFSSMAEYRDYLRKSSRK